MKKKKSFKIKPAFLLIAAAVLLLASTVGSTQAALTYYSENYKAELSVPDIGVKLLENDTEVKNSAGAVQAEWSDSDRGVLLGGKLKEICADESIKEVEPEELVLGKKYQEQLRVENNGAIDAYVRMIITKSWIDKNGVKDTTLSPTHIELELLTDSGWVVDENASTADLDETDGVDKMGERIVLYYTNILEAGKTSPACTDTIRINPEIGKKVIETVETTTVDGKTYKTITMVYEYDGYTFNIEAEVDAVQTHNAVDAIKSAWGVDVEVDADGVLSLN